MATKTGVQCANCGEDVMAHMCIHAVPCCPGKCPGRVGQLQVEAEYLATSVFLLPDQRVWVGDPAPADARRLYMKREDR